MYSMKNDYFKNDIEQQYKQNGSNLYSINSEFIINSLNNSTNFIKPINLTAIEKGKFYFIFYDINGKTSNMEKFNPLFVIDWVDKNNTRFLYGVSINFIPINIRVVFFNMLCNFNLDSIEKNMDLTLDKEYGFKEIDFTNIYKLLYNIGFEWSIRQFDITKINKVYSISTNVLTKFITMSTAKLTGVNDGKIIEIWNKKIQEQEERHKKIIDELLGDYKNMEKELNKTYTTLDTKNNNLEKTLQLIKKIF